MWICAPTMYFTRRFTRHGAGPVRQAARWTAVNLNHVLPSLSFSQPKSRQPVRTFLITH